MTSFNYLKSCRENFFRKQKFFCRKKTCFWNKRKWLHWNPSFQQKPTPFTHDGVINPFLLDLFHRNYISFYKKEHSSIIHFRIFPPFLGCLLTTRTTKLKETSFRFVDYIHVCNHWGKKRSNNSHCTWKTPFTAIISLWSSPAGLTKKRSRIRQGQR